MEEARNQNEIEEFKTFNLVLSREIRVSQVSADLEIEPSLLYPEKFIK